MEGSKGIGLYRTSLPDRRESPAGRFGGARTHSEAVFSGELRFAEAPADPPASIEALFAASLARPAAPFATPSPRLTAPLAADIPRPAAWEAVLVAVLLSALPPAPNSVPAAPAWAPPDAPPDGALLSNPPVNPLPRCSAWPELLLAVFSAAPLVELARLVACEKLG